MKRPRRSKSAGKSVAGLPGSGAPLEPQDALRRQDTLRPQSALGAAGGPAGSTEGLSAREYHRARQKAERLEAVGGEVVKRLDAAIASITAVLRGR